MQSSPVPLPLKALVIFGQLACSFQDMRLMIEQLG